MESVKNVDLKALVDWARMDGSLGRNALVVASNADAVGKSRLFPIPYEPPSEQMLALNSWIKDAEAKITKMMVEQMIPGSAWARLYCGDNGVEFDVFDPVAVHVSAPTQKEPIPARALRATRHDGGLRLPRGF